MTVWMLSCRAGNVFLWDKLARAQPAAAATSFLEDFVSSPAAVQSTKPGVAQISSQPPVSQPKPSSGGRRPAHRHRQGQRSEAGGQGRLEEVTRIVAAAVASVVGADVAPDQPLMEAGLDSLGPPSRHMCFLPNLPKLSSPAAAWLL